MKVLVFCLCMVVAFGIVSSELCHGNDATTCSREKCDKNYHLACVKSECTCLVSACFTGQASCLTYPDHCSHAAAVAGCRCQHSWHCIDNRCYCGGRT